LKSDSAGYHPGRALKQILRAVEDAKLETTIATPNKALRLVRTQFPVASL
jgi:poly(A) polymerase